MRVCARERKSCTGGALFTSWEELYSLVLRAMMVFCDRVWAGATEFACVCILKILYI